MTSPLFGDYEAIQKQLNQAMKVWEEAMEKLSENESI